MEVGNTCLEDGDDDDGKCEVVVERRFVVASVSMLPISSFSSAFTRSLLPSMLKGMIEVSYCCCC